jgi:hypothetical protein
VAILAILATLQKSSGNSSVCKIAQGCQVAMLQIGELLHHKVAKTNGGASQASSLECTHCGCNQDLMATEAPPKEWLACPTLHEDAKMGSMRETKKLIGMQSDGKSLRVRRIVHDSSLCGR